VAVVDVPARHAAISDDGVAVRVEKASPVVGSSS
jgi:hypothetical protein